jgi:hypothetical protein
MVWFQLLPSVARTAAVRDRGSSEVIRKLHRQRNQRKISGPDFGARVKSGRRAPTRATDRPLAIGLECGNHLLDQSAEGAGTNSPGALSCGNNKKTSKNFVAFVGSHRFATTGRSAANTPWPDDPMQVIARFRVLAFLSSISGQLREMSLTNSWNLHPVFMKRLGN